MEQRRLEIVRELRGWIGTPWQHQGRQKGLGVDCIGLAIAAAQAAGAVTSELAAELPSNYGRIPHNNAFLKFMRRNLVPVPSLEEARVADLVLIAWSSFPMHVGILTDFQQHGGTGAPFGLLHAKIELRTVTEQRFDPRYERVHGYYRFRELA